MNKLELPVFVELVAAEVPNGDGVLVVDGFVLELVPNIDVLLVPNGFVAAVPPVDAPKALLLPNVKAPVAAAAPNLGVVVADVDGFELVPKLNKFAGTLALEVVVVVANDVVTAVVSELEEDTGVDDGAPKLNADCLSVVIEEGAVVVAVINGVLLNVPNDIGVVDNELIGFITEAVVVAVAADVVTAVVNVG